MATGAASRRREGNGGGDSGDDNRDNYGAKNDDHVKRDNLDSDGWNCVNRANSKAKLRKRQKDEDAMPSLQRRQLRFQTVFSESHDPRSLQRNRRSRDGASGIQLRSRLEMLSLRPVLPTDDQLEGARAHPTRRCRAEAHLAIHRVKRRHRVAMPAMRGLL